MTRKILIQSMLVFVVFAFVEMGCLGGIDLGTSGQPQQADESVDDSTATDQSNDSLVSQNTNSQEEESQESEDQSSEEQPSKPGEGSNVLAPPCIITHFSSDGEESRFRVAMGTGPRDGSPDCIRCPDPGEVVRLEYSGIGFIQKLEFDGDETNGANSGSEKVLKQQGTVCWSEGYKSGSDLPTASALTVDGHAATLEFDQGPDHADSSGTLSYYRNGVLQFSIDVKEGDVAPYPDDGVKLN